MRRNRSKKIDGEASRCRIMVVVVLLLVLMLSWVRSIGLVKALPITTEGGGAWTCLLD